MRFSKRTLIKAASATALTGALFPLAACSKGTSPMELKDMTGDVSLITPQERLSRIEKAQALMSRQGVGALIIEAGTTLTYFTGIQWWRSERFTGAVLCADGSFCIVTPFFEEPSIREQMTFGDDVRTWHEHESPFELVSGYLAEKNARDAPVAVEETVRHFIIDGVSHADPHLQFVSGAPVVRGCRMHKSPAELALMQKANDITIAAYKHTYDRIEAGMTPRDVSAIMNDATRNLGGRPSFALCLFGEASAYPHGSSQPQSIKEGEVVLMDCGCNVHGYESDISRTWVHGEASTQQRDVWNTVKRGQVLALETAQLGVRAGAVDDAVRAYYESLGYGPGYAAPGLTHRLGHGIGMDGHEPVNFVQGEETALAPGMCFSNEPGIYIPGSFGIRLEDCLYMTENGPKLFSALSKSIDAPFG